MPKITRQTFIQFGVNVNPAADICEFGTPATGSPIYTNVIATLQALTAWTTGWAAETIANNRPFLEDMNAVCYVFSYMIAYMLQMGIAEWDAGTTYYTNSLAQSGGLVYQSLIDNNFNITPVVGASWKLFSQVSGILGAPVSKTASTLYQAATDGTIVGYGGTGGGALIGIAFGPTSSLGTTIESQGYQQGGAQDQGVLTIPIPKGYYYEGVNQGTSINLIWIPTGL